MTVVSDLLANCQTQGIKPYLRDDELRVAAPTKPPDHILHALKRHKKEIIQALQARQCQKIIDDLVARLLAVTTHQEIDRLQAEAEQRLAGHDFYLDDFVEMCGKAHGFLARREAKNATKN